MIVAKGFNPTKKQSEIINSVLNNKAKYHIVSLGRQSGKSLMGMNLMLYWAINHKPCKILWVSPVYSQANKVQKELDNAIRNSNIIESCNYSDNYIKLRTGSEIYFRSAERYDNIRGYTFDYAIMDEAAFMKEETWTEAVRPTLSVRGKKVLFLSTPKGKNWFYDLYQIALSDDYPNYIAYKGSSYDTPFISSQEIEDAKATLPNNVFKQEYLAEFLEGGGEVFTNIDANVLHMWPTKYDKVYCGIDLGKQEDYTVAVFVDNAGNTLGYYRNNKQSWDVLINELAAKINGFNATTIIEVNSVGDVIYEQLSKKVKSIEPFVTTNKSKQEIIEGLILDFNNNNIKIPSKELFKPLYDELGYFTYEYNPKSRSIKYGHPNGLHDDCVIALALANYCRKTKVSKGTYNWMA